MLPLTVHSVTTRQQQSAFERLPWTLYHGDPHWIPPLRANQRELVGFAKHPFHETSQVQAFLAMRGSEPAGRILAIHNPEHVRRHQENLGFFGFFEAQNDPEVAEALLNKAGEWLKSRGLGGMRGPCNPSQNYECGLLVDGFDSPPTFMMTYNHPYYATLLEGAGLRKCQDLYAFWGHVEMIKSLDKKMAFVIEEAIKRFKIELRPIDRKKFHQEVRMFLDIYNKSLVGTWGFTPLTNAEVDHLAGTLKFLIVPEMTSVAMVDGKAVGAVFGLLDYNPRIKSIDGRLFPFGFARLLWNKRSIKRVRLISTNVLPEYQRWGVGLVLMSRLVPEIFKWGIEEAEFSWVLESNHLSRATLERGGAKLTKTYRLYQSLWC